MTTTTQPRKGAAAKKAAPAKKAPARRHDQVQLDSRVREFPAVTLMCRSMGHTITLIPTPPAVAVKHRRQGERLMMLRCNRKLGMEGTPEEDWEQCSYCRDVVIDARNGETIREKTWYTNPAAYLNPEPGTGRIPRAAARIALVSRL